MLFVLIILPFIIAGCGDDREVEQEKLIPRWGYHPYLPLIKNLKCQMDNNDISSIVYGDITGKWKLILDLSKGDTIDYSCNTILYLFSENGILTIESDVEEFPSGEFMYSFNDPYYPFKFNQEPPSVYHNLEIGDYVRYCQAAGACLSTLFVESGEDGRSTDRYDKIFYRIE